MKIFSSKKAQGEVAEESLQPIFAVSIAIFVMLLQLLSQINVLKQYTIFEKGFLERDASNVIDSLYASPNNIVLDYDKDTKWFSFIFGKNSVNTYEKQDILHPDNIAYYFTPDKKILMSSQELKAVLKDKEIGKKITEEDLIEGIDIRFAKTDR